MSFMNAERVIVSVVGIAATAFVYTKTNSPIIAGAVGVIALFFFMAAKSHDASYQQTIREADKMRGKGKAAKSHGSAEFAHYNDLKKGNRIREDGYIIGKFNEKFIRFKQMGHLITFAPTRSGKGVGHVIPNLLTHPGSVVVNDIKGENHAVTHRQRAKFGKVIKFAPFDDDSGAFNPLDFIRVGTPNELDDVRLVADLMIEVPQNASDPFWTNEAKNVVTALLYHVATARPPVLRNLGEVRYLLMQGKEDFDFTIKEMLKSKNEHVRRMAASLSATEPKVMANILSTAKSQTAVWDSPRLVKVTSKSDFTLEEIKTDIVSLFVVIPPEHLEVYKPVIRLMIGLSVAAMTRVPGKPKDNVLFLIDEFPALGNMEVIEMGIGYLAGYGVTLWMFIQDLSQMKATYKKWESFLSNCSVRVAFGTNDFDTAKTLSDMLGNTTIKVKSTGTSAEAMSITNSSKSANMSETARPLMTPDEVMRIPFDAQLIFFQGEKPVIAEKVMYFKDPHFKGKFDNWG